MVGEMGHWRHVMEGGGGLLERCYGECWRNVIRDNWGYEMSTLEI